MAAAKLFYTAGRQVQVPTYLVPATQKVRQYNLTPQICWCSDLVLIEDWLVWALCVVSWLLLDRRLSSVDDISGTVHEREPSPPPSFKPPHLLLL